MIITEQAATNSHHSHQHFTLQFINFERDLGDVTLGHRGRSDSAKLSKIVSYIKYIFDKKFMVLLSIEHFKIFVWAKSIAISTP